MTTEQDRNRVIIFDTTLRDGEQSPGCSMNLEEKLRVAEVLRVLRHGVIDGISGLDALEAIRRGQVVLRLNDLASRDQGLARLLTEMSAALDTLGEGYSGPAARLSLLIASARTQRAVEASPAARALWQLRGSTRAIVYPAAPPFLTQDVLEACATGDQTPLQQHMEPWFDDFASVVDLSPGRMLLAPLTAPVRTICGDGLNIAVLTEHWPPAARDRHAVALANAMVRKWTGLSSLATPTSGIGLRLRRPLAAFAAARRLGPAPTSSVRIDFKLDPDAPGGLRQIEPFELHRNART